MPTQWLAAEAQEVLEIVIARIDKQEGYSADLDEMGQASIQMTIGAVNHFLHAEAIQLEKKTWELKHVKDRSEHEEKAINALVESGEFLEKAKHLFEIEDIHQIQQQILNLRSSEFRSFMQREKELLLASGYSDRKVNQVVDYIIQNIAEIRKPADFQEVRNRLDWLSRRLQRLRREDPHLQYVNRKLLFESLSYVTGGISIIALDLVTEPYIGTAYAGTSVGAGGSMVMLASGPLVKMLG
jgi:hypothetical protein